MAQDSYLNSTTPTDLSGSFLGSYNLIGDGSGGLSSSNHNLLGSTASLLNPKLGPLTGNGGPTQTMLPQAGSPVIDAGSNALIPTGISTDQRGLCPDLQRHGGHWGGGAWGDRAVDAGGEQSLAAAEGDGGEAGTVRDWEEEEKD